MAHETKPCRTCTEPVIWALTNTGRRMPVDPTPFHGGNITLIGAGPPTALVVAESERKGRALYQSHFASCEQAPEHRRPG